MTINHDGEAAGELTFPGELLQALDDAHKRANRKPEMTLRTALLLAGQLDSSELPA